MSGWSLFSVVVVVGLCGGCPPPPDETKCQPKTEADLVALASKPEACALYIENSDLVTLDQLRMSGDHVVVVVQRNDRLTDISGLARVVTMSRLDISENADLARVDLDLSNFVGDEVSLGNNATTSVALKNAPNNVTIGITDSPGLRSVAVGDTAVMHDLRLTNLPALDSFAGFASVRRLDSLHVIDLPGMTLDAVDAFLQQLDVPPTSVEVCGVSGGSPC